MVYGTVVTAEDYVLHNDSTKKFNKSEYYTHPENYHSIFFKEVIISTFKHSQYAAYVSVIMNCMYWDHRYPRIITIDQIRQLVEEKRNRLLAVGDISCDQMGSIEFLMKTTSIDQPLFVYDPVTGECHDR